MESNKEDMKSMEFSFGEVQAIRECVTVVRFCFEKALMELGTGENIENQDLEAVKTKLNKQIAKQELALNALNREALK
jgi:hypothetical protein